MNKIVLMLIFLVLVPVAFAEVDFDAELTAEEEAQFDEILEPVMKVYNFVKYAATVVGVMMLVFAGIT